MSDFLRESLVFTQRLKYTNKCSSYINFVTFLLQCLELTGQDSPVPDYHFKLSAVLGTVYLFYLVDKVLKNIFSARKSFKSKVFS